MRQCHHVTPRIQYVSFIINIIFENNMLFTSLKLKKKLSFKRVENVNSVS